MNQVANLAYEPLLLLETTLGKGHRNVEKASNSYTKSHKPTYKVVVVSIPNHLLENVFQYASNLYIF